MKTHPYLAWLAWSSVGVTLLCTSLMPLLIRANGLPLPANQVMFSIAILAFCTVGALIATRQPTNAIGWIFCALAFVAVGAFSEQYARYALVTRPGALPAAKLVLTLDWLGNAAFGSIFSFTILLFPTGKLPSPRWRPVAWFAAGSIILITCGYALASGPVSERAPDLNNPFGLAAFPNLRGWVSALEAPLLLSAFLASVVSLVVRYRQTRTVERQQIKWFVFATSFMLTVTVINEACAAMFGVRMPDFFFGAMLTLLPISVGIAILRYRLFDIDLIIRRTLVYTVFSLILALIYFGCVVLLEQILQGISGEGQSQFVTVLSTLTIAALFTPLRRRVQAMIDRRFFRRKYDAEQVLATFMDTVRSETDLNKLTEHLVVVIEETLQPTRVSLWLRKTERG